MINVSRDVASQATHAARLCALSGGNAAMAHYHDPVDTAALDSRRNPSTNADFIATIAGLEAVSEQVSTLADDLHLGQAYFAEELDAASPTALKRISRRLGGLHSYIYADRGHFAGAAEGAVAVLLDPIDGTQNYCAGIPMFCSAAAIFIEKRLCASAIYLPPTGDLYTASLADDGWSAAYKEHVGSGLKSPLMSNERGRRVLGSHLTRSDPLKQQAMLRVIQKLMEEFSGVAMLNSGLLALAYVADGALAAFVNNTTEPWDVAAGELLVRATGGHVTSFTGSPIDYWRNGRIEVAATAASVDHARLLAQLWRDEAAA